MPIFRVKSVKIYTGQKKITRMNPWDPWQISGMFTHDVDVDVHGYGDDDQQGSSVTSLARKIDIQRAPVREKASKSR